MGAAGTTGTADDDANSDDDWKTAEGPRGGGEVIAEDLELEELYAEPERTRQWAWDEGSAWQRARKS